MWSVWIIILNGKSRLDMFNHPKSWHEKKMFRGCHQPQPASLEPRNQWDFKGPPILVPLWAPYYSHTTPIRIPQDMGIVWEAYHNYGVPGITFDKISLLSIIVHGCPFVQFVPKKRWNEDPIESIQTLVQSLQIHWSGRWLTIRTIRIRTITSPWPPVASVIMIKRPRPKLILAGLVLRGTSGSLSALGCCHLCHSSGCSELSHCIPLHVSIYRIQIDT